MANSEPCRAITDHIWSEHRNFVPFLPNAKGKIIQDFVVKLHIGLIEPHRTRGTLQFIIGYIWVDEWNALVARANILSIYKLELRNPENLIKLPPVDDLVHPLRLTIDELRNFVVSEGKLKNAPFIMDDYSDEYYKKKLIDNLPFFPID
jgi:hypothetical protein